MFLGFALHTKSNELLDKGDISERDFDFFYKSVLGFHCTAFNYAIDNFPLQNKFLQQTLFVKFCGQKCTFQSVLLVVEKLKSYINFSDQDLCQLEVKILSLYHLR